MSALDRRMPRRLVWLGASLVGVSLSIVAALTALTALVLSAVGVVKPDMTGIMMLSGLIAIGLGLGIPLTFHGWAGWRAQPSRPFTTSRHWRVLLIWIIFVVGGVALSRVSPALRRWLLIPFHTGAMVTPSLAILWWVNSTLRGERCSHREVTAGLAGGGIVGTAAALLAEGVAILVLIVVVAVIISIIPGGTDSVMNLVNRLEDPTLLSDSAELAGLLLSPWVIVSVLGFVTIPVPLLEEAIKTLTMGVFGVWLRPTPARGFLWGVASGAGFALSENLLNGSIGGETGWGMVALARGAATVMHCATGGLVGWGWTQLWTTRRHPLRFLSAYGLAVLFHALWNAAAVGSALLELAAEANRGTGPSVWLMSMSARALWAVLALMAGTLLTAVLQAGRKLGSQRQAHGTEGENDAPTPACGLQV
ncbi:MAG: PrsW family intramembrane metalloprotease [Chloroflexi bacterium]|nr:PrsW family intramembrane metalloprotease [Chloroflexota bacterium]